MFTWDDDLHLQLLLLKSVHCCIWHDVCSFSDLFEDLNLQRCPVLAHTTLSAAEQKAWWRQRTILFSLVLQNASSCPIQRNGVVAVGLHGLVRRDQQFWALHNTLRIHVQPSSALAHCLLLSAGQHRYFWGSVVNCMKDLIWVCNSLDWGTESFNPHFSPCLFHLCDVPVCWQKRRWHRAGNMPWEEPASSSSSTQLGHLKWLRNCGLSCPVV